MAPLNLEEFEDDHSYSKDLKRPIPQPPSTPSAGPDVSPAELERARLQGYEDGYQTGWDDAVRQEAEAQGRIGAEFARNLQDLGFTFHEARTHVMQALEPLLTGMVEKVLPQLVSETLGQTILEEVMALAAQAADSPIRVLVAPSSREVLDGLLQVNTSIPIEVLEEPTLADGQVYLRQGDIEKRIDLNAAVDKIGIAIKSLYELNERVVQNG